MKTRKSKTLQGSKTLSIKSHTDVVNILAYSRSLASEIGFNESDRTAISKALSEICRNVIDHAGEGKVTIERGDNRGDSIIIIVTDRGPGIEDVDKAMQEGFSSGNGLGIGLPGAKHIMDHFEIQSDLGKGTTVKMCKWLSSHSNIF